MGYSSPLISYHAHSAGQVWREFVLNNSHHYQFCQSIEIASPEEIFYIKTAPHFHICFLQEGVVYNVIQLTILTGRKSQIILGQYHNDMAASRGHEMWKDYVLNGRLNYLIFAQYASYKQPYNYYIPYQLPNYHPQSYLYVRSAYHEELPESKEAKVEMEPIEREKPLQTLSTAEIPNDPSMRKPVGTEGSRETATSLPSKKKHEELITDPKSTAMEQKLSATENILVKHELTNIVSKISEPEDSTTKVSKISEPEDATTKEQKLSETKEIKATAKIRSSNLAYSKAQKIKLRTQRKIKQKLERKKLIKKTVKSLSELPVETKVEEPPVILSKKAKRRLKRSMAIEPTEKPSPVAKSTVVKVPEIVELSEKAKRRKQNKILYRARQNVINIPLELMESKCEPPSMEIEKLIDSLLEENNKDVAEIIPEAFTEDISTPIIPLSTKIKEVYPSYKWAFMIPTLLSAVDLYLKDLIEGTLQTIKNELANYPTRTSASFLMEPYKMYKMSPSRLDQIPFHVVHYGFPKTKELADWRNRDPPIWDNMEIVNPFYHVQSHILKLGYYLIDKSYKNGIIELAVFKKGYQPVIDPPLWHKYDRVQKI